MTFPNPCINILYTLKLVFDATRGHRHSESFQEMMDCRWRNTYYSHALINIPVCCFPNCFAYLVLDKVLNLAPPLLVNRFRGYSFDTQLWSCHLSPMLAMFTCGIIQTGVFCAFHNFLFNLLLPHFWLVWDMLLHQIHNYYLLLLFLRKVKVYQLKH